MVKATKTEVEVSTRNKGPSHNRRSSKNFLGMLDDGELKPSQLVLQRMRDEQAPLSERLELAKALLPYELPKLQSIEAHIRAEVTFEDALSELEGGMIDITPNVEGDEE